MKVSREGLVALARHEGIVVAPYRDVVGVWTWGVGHTAGAGHPDPSQMPPAMPATAVAFNDAIALALNQFATDLQSYEKRVRDAVKVTLSQHEFDALVSFDFNTGGIFKAKLTKLLNAGDRKGAARAFMGWLKPEAIRGRRMAEMTLFESGDYGGGKVPIYATDGAGRLAGIRKTLMPDELLSLMGEFGRGQAAPEVPQEVREVVEDAHKPLWKSKQIRAVVVGWFMSAYAFWQAADTETRVAIVAFALVFLFIFADRIRKAVLGGKGAKRLAEIAGGFA